MKKTYKLSAPQNSILLTEQYYKGSSINNIGGGIIVHETLDFDLFKKAINNFVNYNDSFRIRLKQTSSSVEQYFEDYSEFDIDIIDLNDESEVVDLDKKILYEPINIFEEKIKYYIDEFETNKRIKIKENEIIIPISFSTGERLSYIKNIISILIEQYDIESYNIEVDDDIGTKIIEVVKMEGVLEELFSCKGVMLWK